MSDVPSRVVIGRIGKAYGLQGWMHVHSFTDPMENLLAYQPWQIQLRGQWQDAGLADSRRQGNGIVIQIAGCSDREATRLYTNVEIAVDASVIPEAGGDDYYWRDLEGLTVKNLAEKCLGRVSYLAETGSNDVLVVEGEGKKHVVPFLMGDCVKTIDLAAGVITVDWDEEF